MSMNELFTTELQATTSARTLTGTAQLTAIASEQAAKILKQVNENIDEYRPMVAASQKDHGAMDKLIEATCDLEALDLDFLRAIDPAVLDGMLKSQQSKRSRSKGKQMTLDNYKAMMVGAIAENMIRLVTGSAKNAAGSRRASGSVVFTDDELEALKNDQELLRKELRNVQSKKSIAKSKQDFDPMGDKWQELLVAEAQLKAIRVSTTGSVVEVDTTKDKLQELLGEVDDIEKLTSKDSKTLMVEIKKLIG